MSKLDKFNNCNLIVDVEGLKNHVISTGKPFNSFLSNFYLFELVKEQPTMLERLQEQNDLKERLSSKEWQERGSIPYSIIYPTKELRARFEEIPFEELENQSCADIYKTREIPLSLVIEYRSLLLYISAWNDSGLIQIPNPKINFRSLKQTCLSRCKEWQKGLVDCFPDEGY